jgi:Tol biopolymer transport system component
VYLRGLDDFRPRKLANTDGALSVFFAPDGEWVGFKVDRELRKVPRDGGASVLLASNARMQRGAASWGPDGAITYTSIGNTQRIEWVGENGEQMESHLPADWDGIAQWPTYVPNGRGIIFQVCESFVCADDLGLHVLDFAKGEVRRLVEDATRGWVLPSGYLLYSREDGAAFVAPFDLEALELAGSAVPMLENVQTGIDGVGRIAVSNVGNIAYLKGSGARHWGLVWVTRDGNVRPLPVNPRNVLGVRLSPDGSRIAATVLDEDGRNIWIFSPDGTSEARVTFSNNDSQPMWMPGGSSIAFQTNDSSGVSINAQTVDLSSPIRPIAHFSVTSDLTGLTVTPDGSRLHFGLSGQNTQGFDLIFVKTDGQSDPEVFYQTTANERYPAVSADGQLLAYISDESGEDEVYVRQADGTGGREPVSSGGAQEVVWSPVGPELFYRGPDGMYSATINLTNGVQVVRRRLFDDSEFSRTFGGFGNDLSYDVDPTGENFLMIREQDRGAVRLEVILSWFEELKAKVGN